MTISDNFDRQDNQDISENYIQGFKWYEYPLNLGGNTPYLAHENVFIENNKLKLIRDEYCGITSVVADFSEYGSLRTYEDGNITFTWQSGAIGDSNRWHTGVVFGQDLWERETYDEPCQSSIYNYFVIRLSDELSKTELEITNDPATYKDSIYLFNILTGQKEVISLNGSHKNQRNNITLTFYTEENKCKIWINELFISEFSYTTNDAELINSLGFFVVNNQAANTVPYSYIDDLEVNLNIEEPEQVDPRLYEYAPIFVHHPDDLFTMKEIQSMLSLSDLNQGLMRDQIIPGPLEIEDIEGLVDTSLSIDLNNVDMYNVFDHPHPDDFSEYNPKVYGRVVEDENDYTYLQYFVFYPFQDWHYMDHEGDWEFIQVILNDMDVIEDVYYYFNWRFKEVYYDTDYLDFEENHPYAYVSKGNHNMYGSDEIMLPFLDKLNESQRFWIELMWGFKSLDKISKSGQVFVPKNLELEGTKYEIEEIDDETGWINYQGIWGEKHIIPYKSGQMGPKFNSRYYEEWMQPGTFTFGVDMPFIGVFLWSPLDIYLLDEQGNYMELEFYTGPENEPEVALSIEDAPYTVILNATDDGKFNLSVFFYDGEDGIKVRYNGINNTATTIGKLEVYSGSDFKLCLDYEPDGEYDVCYYPYSFVLLGKYEYQIPDLDNDGIDDLKDNCVELSNPLQEDFNDNGKGDACDNPRYYKEKAYGIVEDKNAKKHIELSLKENFWINDFEIKNPSVIVLESAAVKRASDEVSLLLCEADKLLIEYKLQNIDKSKLSKQDIIKLKLAERFYEKGKIYQDLGKYAENYLVRLSQISSRFKKL